MRRDTQRNSVSFGISLGVISWEEWVEAIQKIPNNNECKDRETISVQVKSRRSKEDITFTFHATRYIEFSITSSEGERKIAYFGWDTSPHKAYYSTYEH